MNQLIGLSGDEMTNPKLDNFLVLGLSAREGDFASIRELASFPIEEQEEILNRWIFEVRKINPDAGLMYLGTCHRIELYSFGVDASLLKNLWQKETGFNVDKLKLHVGAEAYR